MVCADDTRYMMHVYAAWCMLTILMYDV